MARQNRKLEEIRELAKALVEAEKAVARVRRQMGRALLDAYDQQIRPAAIAEAAGITRQRLHQLLVKTREEMPSEGGRR